MLGSLGGRSAWASLGEGTGWGRRSRTRRRTPGCGSGRSQGRASASSCSRVAGTSLAYSSVSATPRPKRQRPPTSVGTSQEVLEARGDVWRGRGAQSQERSGAAACDVPWGTWVSVARAPGGGRRSPVSATTELRVFREQRVSQRVDGAALPLLFQRRILRHPVLVPRRSPPFLGL